MSLFTTDKAVPRAGEKRLQSRVERLRDAVQSARPGICTDRALLWTDYCKNPRNRKKPAAIQMAEALREVLLKKKITIYPDELIVGNYTSRRVGGSLFPELHGVPVMMDIFKFSKRKTNPLQISGQEIWRLLKIVPFWLFRFMAIKAYRSLVKTIRLLLHQLKGYFYIINESGGISHIAPDYEKLINMGTDGIISEANEYQQETRPGSEKWAFYEGVKIVCDALARFGRRYAERADKMAASEPETLRKEELQEIAAVCRDVPRKGASSFREALQSLFFAQIAINLESLDNAVCPGRMDQYLYPFYKKDVKYNVHTRQEAKALVAAFSIKMSEIIPVFSEYLTGIHGGMFNGQVVTVGGLGRDGKDATNDLSYIFLEVMIKLRMRQPNYHARISENSPQEYLTRINAMLAAGSNSPALYNDAVIVDTMCKHGYDAEDARDYTGVGCVEPVSQGKSFSSTDAAIVNVPILLELALNRGKRFGSRLRSGAETMPVDAMQSMEDVKTAFEKQLAFQLSKLIEDLQAIESANRKYHPTPLTSSLLEGCIETGSCSTAGGARYNFSGIQCVAPADTGDSLYAIEQAVFVDQKISLPDLAAQLKQNLADANLRAYLKGLAKFGNDIVDVDRWVVYVVNRFTEELANYTNTRGGKYVTGLYSVTIHEYYGRITGALPNGRRKGESFSSGISPANGMDRLGPTALINSVNRIDFTKIANGINFNLKFDRQTLRGKTGQAALATLLKTHFKKGGMQAQVNVLDPVVLIEARDNPERHPHLLVRVSGYSAYFNDLSPEMKEEIIQRSNIMN